MGLTIHYKFSYKGTRSSLNETLRKLRFALGQFPVDVRQLFYYEPGELKNEVGYGLSPRADEERWYYARDACSMLKGSIKSERKFLRKGPMGDVFRFVDTPSADEVAERWEAFVLPVYVMEGCEPFVVTIGREQGSLEWVGENFTKTQYAKNFYRAHLFAVAMLDLCNEAGILERVSDEGNYYETRDLGVLGRELDAYRAVADSVGKLFEKAADELGLKAGGKALEKWPDG